MGRSLTGLTLVWAVQIIARVLVGPITGPDVPGGSEPAVLGTIPRSMGGLLLNLGFYTAIAMTVIWFVGAAVGSLLGDTKRVSLPGSVAEGDFHGAYEEGHRPAASRRQVAVTAPSTTTTLAPGRVSGIRAGATGSGQAVTKKVPDQGQNRVLDGMVQVRDYLNKMIDQQKGRAP